MSDNVLKGVVGFMLSHDRKLVALIRKNRPAYQKGKLNGIGGKLEDHEQPIDAMVREFFEETGAQTTSADWTPFAKLTSEKWHVWFYFTFGDVTSLKAMTDEQVEIVSVGTLGSENTMSNVRWMIPLCLDDRRAGDFYQISSDDVIP